MAKWINAHDRLPKKPASYFVKLNGRKDIMRLESFSSKIELCDSFLWLDESEDSAGTAALEKIKTIDDFCTADRIALAEALSVPAGHYVKTESREEKQEKYYLRIIADLRKQLSDQQKNQDRTGLKEDLLAEIKQINNNPFFDIKK